MAKLTLQDVANLQNESTVVTALASNNNVTEIAMEKTLSRDGQSPNQMLSNFDMNNYKIINLPDGVSDQEPATYSQLQDAIGAFSAGAVIQAPYVTLGNNATLTNERALTAGTNLSLTDGGANSTVTLAVSDNELNALAATTAAADKLPYYNGVATATTTDFTPYARTLIDDTDATTARATLGAVIGTNVQAWDADLDAVAGLSSSGLVARTGAGTAASRILQAPAAGFTITNPAGTAGDPTFVLANDLAAVEAMSGTGLAAHTGTSTWTERSLTAPAAGITITNPAGIAGNPTLVLANDLGAVEALSTTGIARRTGTDTWTASNAVTNAELNTMGAFTFKGNNTSGTATPTDVDIHALTLKATPAATDEVIISDQAASGAWKRATVSSVGSGGGTLLVANNLSELTATAETARNNIFAAPFDALAGANEVLNGGFEISQENGATQTTLTSAVTKYSLDQWQSRYVHAAATAVIKFQQIAPPNSPSFGLGFPMCQQLIATTALSAPAAGDGAFMFQPIEGYRMAKFGFGNATNAQSVTLSFWICATITGTATAALQNNAGNRTYPVNFTVNAANTWEYKTITIPADTTGTWLTTNGAGVYLFFCFAAGSNNQGTNATWNADSKVGTASTTNFFATANNNVNITGVGMWAGTVAPSAARSPLAQRPFTEELTLCQRYYRKSFPQTVSVAQNAGVTGAITVKNPIALGDPSTMIYFTPVMRATPTITTYNPSVANANWRDITAGSDVTVSVNPSSTMGDASVLLATSGTVATLGDILAIHYTADARI